MNWSLEWQLPLNVQKCKVIHYGKKNPSHDYQMGNEPLHTDFSEKDVGVTFDPTLNFRLHIRTMIAKANSRVGIIKRSFSRLNKKSFKILYKSLVRPILEYCSVIWNPLFKGDSDEIEKVQRRATKVVPELRNLPYEERLRELNLTTLIYRRKRTDILQVFRIKNGIDKLDFKDFFSRNTNPTRGHKWKINKPGPDTNIRQHFFSVRVIDDWNALPEYAVCMTDINHFKSAIEKLWRNDPCKYNPDGL